MATLKEYFLNDFTSLMCDFTWKTKSVPALEINVKVGIETHSSAKFVAYYVPECTELEGVLTNLVQFWPRAIEHSQTLEVISGFTGDIHLGCVGSSNSVFVKRIYIYRERELSDSSMSILNSFCKAESIWLTMRGSAYLNNKTNLERPLAFICHDSRDKIDIVTPIAIGLQKLLCPVWYDEYSLNVGDSLRETVEKGLKETRKCILIISQHFLGNVGWPKTEFNSVFTREVLEGGSNVVLPVWHGVEKNEAYEYSPSLANKVAVKWELGPEEVMRRLYRAIMAEQP